VRLRTRSNPAPLGGAIFVRNPRRNKGGSKRRAGSRRGKARRGSRRVSRFTKRNVGYKRNRKRNRGFKSWRANTGRRRNRGVKRNRGMKRNGRSFRRNRGSIRRNRGLRRNGRSFRRNRGARRNGRGFKRNRSFKSYRFKKNRGGYRRNRGARRNPRRNGGRRRNPGAAARIPGVAAVTRLVGKVPGLKVVAPYIGTAVFQVIAGAGLILASKYLSQYLPSQLQPVKYLTMGTVVAAVVGFVPKSLLSTQTKLALGAAAFGVGAVIDTARYLTSRGYDLGSDDDTGGLLEMGGLLELGDGGAYNVSSIDSLGDSSMLMQDYQDASLGDAFSTGGDMSAQEGQAALMGAPAWRATFGQTPIQRINRQTGPGGQSRHAGRQGHRWGWMIRLVGWDRFRQLASLDSSERQEVIGRIRADAIRHVQNATATAQVQQAASAPGGSGYGGLAVDMNGMMATGAAY
jgi:hypothetical protein